MELAGQGLCHRTGSPPELLLFTSLIAGPAGRSAVPCTRLCVRVNWVMLGRWQQVWKEEQSRAGLLPGPSRHGADSTGRGVAAGTTSPDEDYQLVT